MHEKQCSRCLVAKTAENFRADPRYKSGLASWCHQCHRERNSSWARENRQRLSAKSAEWRSVNAGKAREINVAFKARHKERLAVAYASWAKENRDKRRATDAARKAAKLRATPSWANRRRIAAIYRQAETAQRQTGIRMHVDHIVPLQHPLVCGLHCEANLQVLPGAENEGKRNRWWPDMPDIEAAYKQPRLFDEPAPKPVQTSMLEAS